jgi:small redox-active disulfide protein 2
MKTTIKILGTGCTKCKITFDLITELVEQNNINASIEKIEDMMQIMEYNVLSTPAVIINEKLVVFGRVPNKEEILNFINNDTTPSDSKEEGCCSQSNCC